MQIGVAAITAIIRQGQFAAGKGTCLKDIGETFFERRVGGRVLQDGVDGAGVVHHPQLAFDGLDVITRTGACGKQRTQRQCEGGKQ